MSVFTKIISGEIPAYRIAEDENFLAFLDVFPITKGHVLVIPKEPSDKFYDVSNELLSEWLLFIKPIARAIERSFPCKRCGLSIIGLEVPHAHIHLMPINNLSDMDFTKPKLAFSDEEMNLIRDLIIANIEK